jgi:hypothetical protein
VFSLEPADNDAAVLEFLYDSEMLIFLYILFLPPVTHTATFSEYIIRAFQNHRKLNQNYQNPNLQKISDFDMLFSMQFLKEIRDQMHMD